MSPPFDAWVRAYLATQIIEVPIVAGWLRGRIPAFEAAAVGVLASTITHPALWYVWPDFEPYWLRIGAGEAIVWAVEALLFAAWLRRAGEPRPVRVGVAVSCLANASSMLTGFVLLG